MHNVKGILYVNVVTNVTSDHLFSQMFSSYLAAILVTNFTTGRYLPSDARSMAVRLSNCTVL